jgi:serine/threonine protein kinase
MNNSKARPFMNDCRYEKQHIDTYRLLHLLGQSDMSEVYMAEDSKSQKKVAVKLLYGRWEGTEAQKFLNQTAMLKALQHKQIMPILNYGIEDGIAYIVTPYTPYGNLRQRHPKGSRIDLEATIAYVKQAAEALQYIHDCGFIHRDVKPHNLLIGEQNELLLNDFGTVILASSLKSMSGKQQDFEGTAPYAAPEQLQGKPASRSDQYALGIMVYEWLTGDWPFNGSFYEITHQHLFVAPPSLKEKGIDCPANIEQVIMRALEKEPAKRYPTIKRFAEELEWAYKIAQARNQRAMMNKQIAQIKPQQEYQRQPQFRLPFPLVREDT